jgi:hypothetical protein
MLWTQPSGASAHAARQDARDLATLGMGMGPGDGVADAAGHAFAAKCPAAHPLASASSYLQTGLRFVARLRLMDLGRSEAQPATPFAPPLAIGAVNRVVHAAEPDMPRQICI